MLHLNYQKEKENDNEYFGSEKFNKNIWKRKYTGKSAG